MIGEYCKLYKTCSICGRFRHHSKFASNGCDKSRRKSFCHDCKFFKMRGLKNIFDTQRLRKSSIKVEINLRSNNRVFYRISYEDAVKMVEERMAGIVNNSLIRQFNVKDIVLHRDGYVCKYCKEKGSTIDHVIPRSKGGKTSVINLVCACEECNKEKGNLSLEEFLTSGVQNNNLRQSKS